VTSPLKDRACIAGIGETEYSRGGRNSERSLLSRRSGFSNPDVAADTGFRNVLRLTKRSGQLKLPTYGIRL